MVACWRGSGDSAPTSSRDHPQLEPSTHNGSIRLNRLVHGNLNAGEERRAQHVAIRGRRRRCGTPNTNRRDADVSVTTRKCRRRQERGLRLEIVSTRTKSSYAPSR